jgi:L-ascorbate metabolism protein UlaG (beta-lactamase superfamily)
MGPFILDFKQTYGISGSNPSGPGGIRTLDLFSAIEARSQLRYRPIEKNYIIQIMRREKMMKLLKIFISMIIILSITACGSTSDLVQTSGHLITQSPTITTEDVQTQQTSLPTTDILTEPPSPFIQIQTTLRSNPPCTGNNEIRQDAILTLDGYLKDDASRWDPDVITFYSNMMGFVESEIAKPVTSGIKIWSMYNHGFIVKTPSSVFAFDLVQGYPTWKHQIPNSILEQIQVLFLSHKHDDHWDRAVIRAITDLGGKVVAPLEEKLSDLDLVYLSADEESTQTGLHIKAYDGLHGGVPVRMYVVTTPEGLTIMHTGDNQTSETLPDGLTVDILLLNAWVNESGSASPVVGVRNSINKLNPRLTILGHIQEMSHSYDPSDPKSRLSFEAPLAVDDGSLPGDVSVQVWGESCDFPPE